MTDKRTDTEGNELYNGEYQKSDGRYAFHYKNREGENKWIYARRLTELRNEESKIIYREYINISKKIKNITLNDQFELWLSGKSQLRNNTRESYRYLYDTYVRNSLGRELIDEISTFRVKSHYSTLLVERRIATETVSHIQNVLYQVFQSALEREVIQRNPAEHACKEFVRAHSKHTSKRPGLCKEHAELFLDHIRNSDEFKRWYPLICMFIYTGLRISEMAGIRWDDIDMERKTINVDHVVMYCTRGYDKAGFHIFSPKTVAGKRKIPFGSSVVEALNMEKDFQQRSGVSCKISVDGYDGFLFTNKNGGIIVQSCVNRAIERMVLKFNEAKHRDRKGETVILPKITSHSLRHTFANILCEDDVNIKVMQVLLGHSDIETTMNIYTSVHTDFLLKEYAEKVQM